MRWFEIDWNYLLGLVGLDRETGGDDPSGPWPIDGIR